MAAVIIAAAAPVWAGGGKELKGMEIVIGNFYSDWNEWDVNTFKPRTDSEEKLLAQRKKLMQEYNFVLKEKAITDWNGMMQLAAISTMSGKPAADVFVVQSNWAMALRAQGLIAPVGNSKAVNFKNPQPVAPGLMTVPWNQSTINSFTFNGQTYAFSIGGNVSNAQVVYFNKRLFREAGMDPNLPYDMQKNGTWTWDNFLNICKRLTRDINNDGITDTYAMTRDVSTEMLDAIVSSNGATYVDRDPKTGKFFNATNKPEFLEALQYAIRLNNEGVLKKRPDNTNWDWYKSEFVDGKVAMRIDESYVGGTELKQMKDDWGMVLFPKGPKSSTYRVYTRDNVMVIPSTKSADEIDKILWAVSLWYTPVDDDWKSGQYNLFRDSRAIDETLTLIRDEKLHMIKYFTYIQGLERGDIAWTMWYHDGDPAQLVESVSQSWNDLINQTNGLK